MFGFGKKKDEAACCCGNTDPGAIARAEAEKGAPGIRVLGGGCARCHELENNAQAALASLGIGETVELITDYAVIAAYGVMTTPALVVDGRVISCGKVLKPAEVAEAVKKARGV